MYFSRLGVKTILPLVSCLGLCACGGGSGNNVTPTAVVGPAPAPPPVAVNYDTAEFRHNYGLGQIKALTAYDNGATGAGVTVAVIDSGIDIDHPQIEANIHNDSTNIVTGNVADLNDIDGHGTAVAGVIAAVRDPNNNASTNVHGVAFDAKILALNAASTGSCEADGCSFYDSDIAAALDYARVRGVKVVNISLGGDDFNTPNLVNAYKRAVDAGMVIVIAAGNRDETDTDVDLLQPENSAAVAWSSWANGQIILSGAVDSSGTIADFSHKAGEVAKDVYLVAGGDRILTLGQDGQYFYYSGTSFSTPHIAGAAALLMSAFPNLTGKEVADLLFESATDLGATGNDGVYGQGLVNLEVAFQPQGTSSIAVRAAASPSGGAETVTLDNSVILGGAAFGGLTHLSAAVGEAMLLDGYDRSFRVDLGQQIFSQADPLQLETLLGSKNGSRQTNLRVNDTTHVALSWREDMAFKEVEETYFSHQNQSRNRNKGLRMKLGMSLGAEQKMTFAQGHSLKETLEDYEGDEFLTIGKGDFMALSGGQSQQNIAVGQTLNAKTQLSMAVSRGQRDWALYNVETRNHTVLTRVDHKVSPRFSVGVDLGAMVEDGSVLGSLSQGALSLGQGADTAFLKVRLKWAMSDKVTAFSTASYGVTAVQSAALSLVESIGDLQSSSFSFGLVGTSLFQEGDRLSFAVSQPLRVVKGQASVAQVSVRDYSNNSLTFIQNQISLAPEGHQIDVEVAYQIGHIFGADVALNALHQINPNHSSSAPDNSALLIRFGSTF